MSMRTDCVYGYGFEVAVSDENLVKFFNSRRNLIEEMAEIKDYQDMNLILDWLDSHNPDGGNVDSIKEDLYDFEGDLCANGIYGAIANIMAYETNIRFEYRYGDEYEDAEAILLPDSRPWYYNRVEKELTEESLSDICKKYMKELYNPGAPDFIRLEYSC